MGEITQQLVAARAGDRAALHAVFDRLYPELRRIARTRVLAGERTLTPTVLVNEAFVHLVGNDDLALVDRRHFLACAARAMRAIAIDHLRRRSADKRGGGQADLPLDDIAPALPAAIRDDDLLALDQGLARLDTINPRQCEVVELHFFGGVDFATIAALLQCSERTAKREWERARAFLHAQLEG
jgi:RNA polymerase sigma factor (TIGR02999 family)